jgi:hypothetical protein
MIGPLMDPGCQSETIERCIQQQSEHEGSPASTPYPR